MTHTRSPWPRGGATRAGRRRILSVRSRIVVAILVVAAFGLATSGVACFLVQRQGALASVDSQLLGSVPNLKTIASRKTSGAPPTSVDAVLRAAMQQMIPASNVSVLGLVDGKPAVIPGVDLPFRIEKDSALVARMVAEANPTLVVMGTAKSSLGTLRYVIIPVRVAGDASTGLYVAAHDLDAELDSVAESFQTYILVALVALALVGLVASMAAGRLLRPVRLLRDAAARSSTAADLTERIPVTGRDDVSELATAINAMFDRLQDSSMSQRRLLNDVGHELKTPITIIRGHLELLDAGNVSEVEATRTLAIDELDRMSRLVSDISLLAASRAPHFVEVAEVDIETFTAAVGAKASALDPSRTWRVESASGLALVDSHHITQAWLQLADNAVKYSTPGAPIAILAEVTEVTDTGTCPWLDMSVRDSGPGIPPDARERIFERFSRLEFSGATEGSGLGLSIVSAIAKAHRGSVQLSGAPGEGSTFTIRIPLVAEPLLVAAG